MTQQFLKIFLLFSALVHINAQTSNCAPPPSLLPEQCCAIPSFFNDADLIKCKTASNIELSRVKRFATSRMELGTCYLHCVFESTGVTLGGGRVLDTNKLLQILSKETPNEPQTLQVISAAVSHCINDLNSGTMKIRSPTLYNCSTIPSAIMSCVHKNFFLNCPSNRFQATSQCYQLKDYIQRCAVTI
ncbi:hypothetical protein PVAND_008656 [Polypedilum vanderplanki]|uniref:OBP47-like domain-containing protein n=1 Tax=Polypedilum vanderplanki TaxID=319348 RepID=A0A9J6CBE1_POLVA|nr:hypothetical protein PVAND_008656 [Polypedilum vanderplanki]